jgi:hypothetical protein
MSVEWIFVNTTVDLSQYTARLSPLAKVFLVKVFLAKFENSLVSYLKGSPVEMVSRKKDHENIF